MVGTIIKTENNSVIEIRPENKGQFVLVVIQRDKSKIEIDVTEADLKELSRELSHLLTAN